MSSVADVPDMCSSINETFIDIRSLTMSFTTQAVTSAVACRCSIAPVRPCETTSVGVNEMHASDQCVFSSTVQEEIDVIDIDILGSEGRGDFWRETCEFDETDCRQCLITSNVTFTEESLNTTRKLVYFFRQSSGYGEGQHINASIAIKGEP